APFFCGFLPRPSSRLPVCPSSRLPVFPSSRLPVFPSSRLPVFPSSRLPVFLPLCGDPAGAITRAAVNDPGGRLVCEMLFTGLPLSDLRVIRPT
ncbi:MAG: hypothetical protein LBG44_01065, partial [Gemmatimonadota bacterium]|nr:hypothetical protein [Gemmatimonadota bacterium]